MSYKWIVSFSRGKLVIEVIKWLVLCLCRDTRHADGLFTSGYSKLLGQLSARRYLESLIGKRVRYMNPFCMPMHSGCAISQSGCGDILNMIRSPAETNQRWFEDSHPKPSKTIKPDLNIGNQLKSSIIWFKKGGFLDVLINWINWIELSVTGIMF